MPAHCAAWNQVCPLFFLCQQARQTDSSAFSFGGTPSNAMSYSRTGASAGAHFNPIASGRPRTTSARSGAITRSRSASSSANCRGRRCGSWPPACIICLTVLIEDFVEDLAGRKLYLQAVDNAFGGYIDYSVLVKIYGSEAEGEKRYLGVRMTKKRFTRLTNAFSKKIENHVVAVALGYFATTSSGFAARFA